MVTARVVGHKQKEIFSSLKTWPDLPKFAHESFQALLVSKLDSPRCLANLSEGHIQRNICVLVSILTAFCCLVASLEELAAESLRGTFLC